MSYRLVAFDMDGTLVKERSSWWTLHEHFETMEGAVKNAEDFESGLIDYEQWMIRDLALWGTRANMSVLDKVLSNYTLAKNSKVVVGKLQRRGYETAIATSGLKLLADKVGKDLGITHVVANELAFDDEGYLTGDVVARVDPRRKHEALAPILKLLDVSLSECVAVGDSSYDREILKNCGLGIALGSGEGLRDVAQFVIKDLIDLLRILQPTVRKQAEARKDGC